MKTIILSAEDIRTIVTAVGLDTLMDQTIDALYTTCRHYDDDKYTIPIRRGFNYHHPKPGLLEWMPAMQNGSTASLKIVGYHPANPVEHHLPTILSVGLTFNTETGHFIGLLDATFPTALRTGAASAVASRILAAADTKVLGLIGAGAQAISQLHGLSRVFEFEDVLLYDIDRSVSNSFRSRAAGLQLHGARIKQASLVDVCRNADILCTVTSVATGKGPVFQDVDLKPGLHVNAVGSDFPGKIEVPRSLLKRSFVCPDFREQAIHEGDCQQLSASDIGPNLIELVKSADTYTEKRDDTTVFDSTGWALEDHILIEILMHHAHALGCGTPVQVESIADDPRDPYSFLSTEDRFNIKAL